LHTPCNFSLLQLYRFLSTADVLCAKTNDKQLNIIAPGPIHQLVPCKSWPMSAKVSRHHVRPAWDMRIWF